MSRKIAQQKQTPLVLVSDRLPGSGRSRVAPSTAVWPLTLTVFILGFALVGGLIAWSAVAPLQGAVVAGGSFEVEGDARVVQHLEGGVVTELDIREGDTVEAGQVVMRLESERLDAQIGILENQMVGALARVARLQAEFEEADEIEFQPELRALVDRYPDLTAALESHTKLFRSNTESRDGEMGIFSERIGQFQRQLETIEARRTSLAEQLAIVQDEVADLRGLLDKQLIRKARYAARKEDEVELLRALSDLEGDAQETLQQIAEVSERRLQVRRQRDLQISEQLEAARMELFDLRQRLATTQAALDRLSIEAPISGRVVGLDINTIGAVVAAGEPLFRIVPENADMAVVARVSPADIDEIAIGQPVRLRLSAYSYRKVAPIEGYVRAVSADTFPGAGGQDYYEVDIRLTDTALNGHEDIVPVQGMPVQAMIATRELTVLTYLLDPIIGGLEIALRESG